MLPHGNRTDGLALGVLDFDHGFGGAGKRDGQDYCEGDEGESEMFHGGIIANFATTRPRVHQWAMLDPQEGGVYCGQD